MKTPVPAAVRQNRRNRFSRPLIALCILLPLAALCLWLTAVLRTERNVYLQNVRMSAAATEKGLTPEWIEERIEEGFRTIYGLAATRVQSLNLAFPDPPAAGTARPGYMSPEKLAPDGKGDCGLRKRTDATGIVRFVRKLFGRRDCDLFLSATGTDTLRIGYTLVCGPDTLSSGSYCGKARNPEVGAAQAVLMAVSDVCSETNPLINVLLPNGWTREFVLNGEESAVPRTRLEKLLEESLPCELAAIDDKLREYLASGPCRRRAYGNLALGILYDYQGCSADDVPALRQAVRLYETACKPADEWLRKAVEERIGWLGGFIADCLETKSGDELIGSFLGGEIRLPDSCRQLILVYNDVPQNVLCAFRRFERQEGGSWEEVVPMIHANVGRAGIAPYGEKREGDGRTPTGVFPLGFAFGYADDIPGLQWPFVTVTDRHLWIDDPLDPHYNRMTTEPTKAASFERLRRDDDAYKYAAVVEYNTRPVEKYRGSAIFFHIESGFGRGSSGCITVSEPRTVETLRWLDPQKAPCMLIGTTKRPR